MKKLGLIPPSRTQNKNTQSLGYFNLFGIDIKVVKNDDDNYGLSTVGLSKKDILSLISNMVISDYYEENPGQKNKFLSDEFQIDFRNTKSYDRMWTETGDSYIKSEEGFVSEKTQEKLALHGKSPVYVVPDKNHLPIYYEYLVNDINAFRNFYFCGKLYERTNLPYICLCLESKELREFDAEDVIIVC